MKPLLSISLLLSVTLLGSCTTERGTVSSISNSPTSAKRGQPTGSASLPPLSGPVSREQAIRRALTGNPSIQALRAEVRAREAEITQAATRPNPELDFEVENFAGTGSTRGLDGAEITTALTQPLEIGGKRSKRTRVAEIEAEVHQAELLSKEREIAIEADRAFTSLLEAAEIKRLSEANLARAEENLATLESLLEAGDRGRIDVNKAKLAVSEARELLAEARAGEAIAASELSSTWGGGGSKLAAADSLSAPKGSNSTAKGDEAVSGHPALRKADHLLSLARANHELEKAKRYSDIEVGGGVRELRDEGETAAVVGVSVPLPVFDRNKGNIRAAEERVARAEAERRAIESQLRTQYEKMSTELLAAQTRVAEFDSSTIEAARQSLQDTTEAYAAGKASLLEVLDARKTLFGIEVGRTRALADLVRAHNSLKIFTQN